MTPRMAKKSKSNAGKKQSLRKRRILPPQTVWPLLFTLGNLVAGFAAIHYAFKGDEWQGPWGWSGLTMSGALSSFVAAVASVCNFLRLA